MNLVTIAWKSIRQRMLASVLTGLSISLGVALMIAVLIVNGIAGQVFNQSSSSYDLIVGPSRGSAIDLVLSSSYRITKPAENLPWIYYLKLKEDPRVRQAIPLAVSDDTEVGQFPIVATVPEYFQLGYAQEHGEYRVRGQYLQGTWDAVIGSQVARQNGWDVGEQFKLIHSGVDDHVHQDLFTVKGVLAATGTPNDRTVFVHLNGFFALADHEKPKSEAIARIVSAGIATEAELRARWPEEFDDLGDDHAAGDHDHDEHEDGDDDHEEEQAPEDVEEHADEDIDDSAGAANDAAELLDEHADDDHADEDDHDDDHEHEDEDHDHDHEHEHVQSEIQKEVSSILIVLAGDDELRRGMSAASLSSDLQEGFVAQAVNPGFVMRDLMDKLVGNIRLTLLYLTGLIVVVSGIGIFVSIYNSMADRKREIAIMRALGAQRMTVFAVILAESILLCVGGGLVGMLLGHGIVLAAAPIVEARSGLLINPLAFEPLELVIIPAMIVLASLVGFLPGLTAYRTDVAEALSS